MSVDFASHIRTVRDYPRPGVLFRDITTLLLKPDVFRRAIDVLAARYVQAGITRVVSIDARGFLIGSPLAYLLDAGQALVRKKGKLPASVIGEDYKLEYGIGRIEIHTDAISPGDRVLLVDDLLATGGTAAAAIELVKHCGGVLHEAAFLVDLPDLGGSRLLRDAGHAVFALCAFAGKDL
jgi:adenine phosphoribosyltransferase